MSYPSFRLYKIYNDMQILVNDSNLVIQSFVSIKIHMLFEIITNDVTIR